MSFADKVNKTAETVGGSGNWFKLKEGNNVFRVLTEPTEFFEKFKVGVCYENCGFKGSPKYLCYIYDQEDKQVKLFRMNFTIAQALAAFQLDDEYKFDGFPMPYNVKVLAKGAGTKEVSYSVIPGRLSELPEGVEETLAKQTSTEDIVEKLRAKTKEGVLAGTIDIGEEETVKPKKEHKVKETVEIEYPSEEVNADDIPF
jgi:hypothetical protein